MTTEVRPNLVVVTGGTGYVGAMVIDQLLKDGYNVRATARPPKVEILKNTYPDANEKLEVVEMADLVLDADKWGEILKGADAVIHIAGPVYHPGTTSEDIYSAAIGGTQKLLDALAETSIKRFVLTSSIAAFFKPDFSNIMDQTVYDHNSWSDIEDINPKEQIPSYTYVACKAISDKLVWKAAEKYPHIDFSTILPPTLYGWFVKDYPVPKNVAELNGNKFLYELIQKGVNFPTWPLTTIAHNRDVAKAHVLALTAPILPKGQKKRFILSLGTMTWVEAIEFLKEPDVVAKFRERGHDIVSRLPDVNLAGMQSQYGLDTSLTENVLGLKKQDYIPWKDILLEVMPNLMDWEKAHPSPIKVGFVGLSQSGWASIVHGPSLLTLKDLYSLTAIATTNADSAKVSATKNGADWGHPVKAYHGGTQSLSQDVDVDLVAVSVKCPLHREALLPVIDAGKDFFVEWPAGKSTAETKELAALAKEKGVRTIVGLQGRHSILLHKIKEIIDSGKIGTVYSTSLIVMSPGELGYWGPTVAQSNRFTIDPTQGATMLDILVGHHLDAFISVFGDFDSVSATASTKCKTISIVDGPDKHPTGETVQNPGKDYIAFSGILKSGVNVNEVWRGGMPSTPGRVQLVWTIDGSEGSLKMESSELGGALLHVRPVEQKLFLNGEEVLLKEGGGLMWNITSEWREFAKGKEGTYATIEDAVKVHTVLDAIRESYETGKRIVIE